ncbi:hypothetical protein HOR96_gp53 [Agrobacterium phage Atu_ph02]|uniref:Uncharacterized protein n=1 Tax=Agrobacterium phage Atu_ph02 TaxID=2024261 RepID=A0A2L0UZ08_9CAUD|nr:hypothetical protein HOR96_gp53 [Agrobacterium phage Atu_ph02]AUZ94761.1 hypothetical protein [Agrobacterium phage Atu_ph02]
MFTKTKTLDTILSAFTKPLAELDAFIKDRHDIAARARRHADALEAEAANQRDGADAMIGEAQQAEDVRDRLAALVSG